MIMSICGGGHGNITETSWLILNSEIKMEKQMIKYPNRFVWIKTFMALSDDNIQYPSLQYDGIY